MGTNSLTSEQNSFFLLDDDNLSLYYGLMSNKSEVEEEEQSLDNIKNVFISEKTENKRPKSNISGDESLKVPITFEWDGGGNNVYVTGNFCNWKQFFLMKKEENGKFFLNLNLPKGKHQYKFKVDGIWKYNEKFPTINENGNINNIIDASNIDINIENIEGKATRANTSNNENIENSKSKKYLSKSKTNSFIGQKFYSNYIPKKDEFHGKVIHMSFKSKSCLNFSQNKIGNSKYITFQEKNILSDNISYKKLEQAQNTDIDHINVKNINWIKNNESPNLICSVPIRYRHKFTTFVYYKPKYDINNVKNS